MATNSLRLNSSVAAVLAVASLIWIPSAVSSVRAPSSGARHLAVPILMYHRIDYLRPSLPEMTRRLTVDPTDFEHQMEWLKQHGFHTLTQRELLDAVSGGRPLPAKPILITFDDGYRDVLGKASPVIQRLRLHATEYVISGRLDGSDSSFLTVPELRLLEQRGIEIGSHTVTHADLPALSDAQAFEELATSRSTLERALGHPVRWFAYPYGAYDGRVVGLVARAGYRLAVTTRSGSCQDTSHPLELKRLEVLDTTGVRGLAAMLGTTC
jgi:peptidoglycan/xylan/chitin deacetylase (PgdA/CDA1 family)